MLTHRIVFRLAECKLVSAIVTKLGTDYEPLSLFEPCADAGPRMGQMSGINHQCEQSAGSDG